MRQACVGRGAAIEVIAARGREQRSQIVFSRGRDMVFWQSPRTRKQAWPDVTLPTARAAKIADLEIIVDDHERYPYRFATQQAKGGTDTALVQSVTDKVTAKTTTYAYDSLDELTGANQSANGTTTASSTTPDATCTSPSTTYSYNAADQLTARNGTTTGYGDDANGNETAGIGATTRTAETYSPSNQLTALTSSGTATSYAGLDNADRTTAGTTSTESRVSGGRRPDHHLLFLPAPQILRFVSCKIAFCSMLPRRRSPCFTGGGCCDARILRDYHLRVRYGCSEYEIRAHPGSQKCKVIRNRPGRVLMVIPSRSLTLRLSGISTAVCDARHATKIHRAAGLPTSLHMRRSAEEQRSALPSVLVSSK